MGFDKVLNEENQVVGIIDIGHGDSGKGKLDDYLAALYDTNLRLSGGPNTGATSTRNGKDLKLHLLPFGTLTPGIENILAGMVLFDPDTFFNSDLVAVNNYRITPLSEKELLIDFRLPVIFPHNLIVDLVRNYKIGTTGRGIGSIAAEFINRDSISIEDLFEPDLDQKIEAKMGENHVQDLILFGMHNENVNRKRLNEIVHLYDDLNPETIAKAYYVYADKLKKFVGDAHNKLQTDYKSGKRILIPGTQGLLLDFIHGDRPYTSSTPVTPNGLLYTSGLPKIDYWLCVIKALPTKVGAGPKPTLVYGDEAENLRKKGSEYGTTTGRPRDVYMHAIPQLKHALSFVPGKKGLVISKTDTVMDEILKVYLDYECSQDVSTFQGNYSKGDPVSFYPRTMKLLSRLKGKDYVAFGPIEDSTNYKNLKELKGTQLGKYGEFLSDQLNIDLLAMGNGKETYLE